MKESLSSKEVSERLPTSTRKLVSINATDRETVSNDIDKQWDKDLAKRNRTSKLAAKRREQEFVIQQDSLKPAQSVGASGSGRSNAPSVVPLQLSPAKASA